MNEIWKDVTGYEGLYKVSNYGNVISLNYKNQHRSHLLSQSKSSTGYLHVQLYKSKIASTKNVHVLVASEFIQKPNQCDEVNHKDGDKTNNHINNLEWVSKSENQKHSIKIGLRTPSPNIGKTGGLHPTSKRIAQYDLDGNFLRAWDSVTEAAKHIGCRPSTISNCLTGKRPTMHGYKWSYLSID